MIAGVILVPVALFVPIVVHGAVEAHLDLFVGTRGQPDLAAGQPVVGQFGLPAVDELLAENPVFI